MRSLAAVACTALVALYAAVAFHIFAQERWALETPPAVEPSRVRNPEAVLGMLQSRFAANRFGDDELELLRRALREAPSFYQPPFLLAAFHASRLSEPLEARAAYEAAVARYPANGRLQLAFGNWLLDSRASLEGWANPEEPGVLSDPLPYAESHLKTAMALEPDLAWNALRGLARNRIPPGRWGALVPDHPLARAHLLDALFQADELDTVWQSLGADLLSSENPEILRRIVHWGLQGGKPDVALEAASAWKRLALESGEAARIVEPVVALSRAQFALGREEESYDAFSEALAEVEAAFGPTSRASLELLCAMGEEYLRRDQSVTAEALFQQAVSKRPSYVPALLGLARTLKRVGDDEQAAERFQEVIRLEPDNESARRELGSLLVKGKRQ